MNDAKNRILFVTPKGDSKRLKFKECDNEVLNVTVDVHGMKCWEARKFLNNILNIAKSRIEISVIHGYNHGTDIKDMINCNFSNPHIQKIYSDNYNMGITHILAA